MNYIAYNGLTPVHAGGQPDATRGVPARKGSVSTDAPFARMRMPNLEAGRWNASDRIT